MNHSLLNKGRHFRRAWILASSLAFGLPGLQAAVFTWDGGSSVDSNWSTKENWSTDVAPSNPALPAVSPNPLPDQIVLSGGVRLAPVVDTPWNLDNLTFGSGTNAFTLSGSTITFQPSSATAAITHDSRFFLINSSSVLQTINNNLVVTPARDTTLTSGSGISAGSGGITLNGNLDLTTNSGFRIQGGGTVTFNGVISGTPSGATAVNGGTVAVFNNINTFTNGFIVYSGTAKVGVNALNGQNGALGNNNTAVTLGHTGSNGASLLTNAAVTVGRDVSFVRNTTTNFAYTVGGSSADVSNFTGTIYNGSSAFGSAAAIVTSVAGGRTNITGITRRSDTTTTANDDTVTKNGAGIVAFTGTSNYAGQTNVSTGTLLINGTLSTTAPNATVAGVVVSSTAVLGGTGTIGRAVTIQSGGILAPGDISNAGADQGGKLTLTSGLTLNNTSALRFNLDNAASLTDDEVAITGNLALDGQLSVTNLGGFGVGSYRLFTYTGALVDGTVDFGTMPVGYTYSIDTVSTPGSVFLNVVPEPTTAAFLALGGALALFRRRRS